MKNITKLDGNIQMTLIKITAKKIKVRLIIIGIVLIFFGIFIYLDEDFVGVVIALVGFTIVIMFTLFWDKLMMKQFKNNNFLKGNTYNYYEFNEDGFTVNTIRDEENIGLSNLKYTDIIKVIENKNYLALFISNAQAFVLCKDNMSEGKSEDLIDFIKSKVKNYNVVK